MGYDQIDLRIIVRIDIGIGRGHRRVLRDSLDLLHVLAVNVFDDLYIADRYVLSALIPVLHEVGVGAEGDGNALLVLWPLPIPHLLPKRLGRRPVLSLLALLQFVEPLRSLVDPFVPLLIHQLDLVLRIREQIFGGCRLRLLAGERVTVSTGPPDSRVHLAAQLQVEIHQVVLVLLALYILE